MESYEEARRYFFYSEIIAYLHACEDESIGRRKLTYRWEGAAFAEPRSFYQLGQERVIMKEDVDLRSFKSRRPSKMDRRSGTEGTAGKEPGSFVRVFLGRNWQGTGSVIKIQ